MDNQYIKTYPDLMADKTIMYVHGFGSAASTNTVKVLQTLLPKAHVIAEDLPISPAETMELLHTLCDQHKPDLIIGTSMGGMYTEMLRGYDRILVNPAFNMGDTMAEHNMMGKQVFQNGGFAPVVVTKKAADNKVDAITGATKTSDCVSDMVRNSLKGYAAALKDLNSLNAAAPSCCEEKAEGECCGKCQEGSSSDAE